MITDFQSINCMCCGVEGVTKHHAIPQRMKPINNVIIPFFTFVYWTVYIYYSLRVVMSYSL